MTLLQTRGSARASLKTVLAVLAVLAGLTASFWPQYTMIISNRLYQPASWCLLLAPFSWQGVVIAYPWLVRLSEGLVLGGLALSLPLILLHRRRLSAVMLALAAAGRLASVLGMADVTVRLQDINLPAAHIAIQFWPYAVQLTGLVLALLLVLWSKDGEEFARAVFLASASISVASVALITLYMLAAGLPAIFSIGPLHFLFGTVWQPTKSGTPLFGILPMMLATITATGGAVLLGVPAGLLTAVFLAEIAPSRLAGLVRPAVELLAGIPSVIYGFFGLQLLVPLVQQIFNLPSGANLFSAIIILAIMILPTIVSTAETGLRSVPVAYKEASLAVGATHVTTIFKVLIPAARSPILSGVILGVGRAIGETMAVIMVAGNVPNLPGLFSSVRPLTVGIALEMSYASGLHQQALFAIGLVLFIFIMLVNISFSWLSKKGVQMHG